MPALSKREHIVQTALLRFSENGFRSTDADQIANEAGVSKKTLYNHFPKR